MADGAAFTAGLCEGRALFPPFGEARRMSFAAAITALVVCRRGTGLLLGGLGLWSPVLSVGLLVLLVVR